MPYFVENPQEPRAVEARRVEGSPQDVYAVAKWCHGEVKTRTSRDGKALTPRIELYEVCPWCREGTIVEADPGDWIVKYPHDCFEVWTASRFKKAFSAVIPTS